MAETVTRAQEAYDRGDAETLASFYAEDGVPEVARPAERGKNEERPF
jgi:ketosteroid isomerase-like protein